MVRHFEEIQNAHRYRLDPIFNAIKFEKRVPRVNTKTAFSKTSVFGCRKRDLRVDATPKRITKYPVLKISGYAWTGHKYTHCRLSKLKRFYLLFSGTISLQNGLKSVLRMSSRLFWATHISRSRLY